MDTSSAVSIWRRFSSSVPHRVARRRLSAGERTSSRGLGFKRFGTGPGSGAWTEFYGKAAESGRRRERPTQRVRQCGGDFEVDETSAEAGSACEVHDAGVGGPG